MLYYLSAFLSMYFPNYGWQIVLSTHRISDQRSLLQWCLYSGIPSLCLLIDIEGGSFWLFPWLHPSSLRILLWLTKTLWSSSYPTNLPQFTTETISTSICVWSTICTTKFYLTPPGSFTMEQVFFSSDHTTFSKCWHFEGPDETVKLENLYSTLR